jgi:mono/diheme cytochrome c family protein
MKSGFKRAIRVFGGVVACAIGGLSVYVFAQTSRFDASLDKVYDVPVPDVAASKDPAVIARGKHLATSLGGCSSNACHGADFGGGRVTPMGPVATLAAPNITGASLGAAYSDGEIVRLVRHGLKKDGRSVRFMPVQDMSWLPQEDDVAIVSYLRTVPPVDRASQPMIVKTLGKILDRQDKLIFDVARRIDHSRTETPPAPAPTAEYGALMSRACVGCHGDHLSGGPIPGAPPSIPTPLNLTPDATGLKDWSFEDFDKLMRTGARKNGKALDPFMPVESWRNLDDVEMHALWAYLRTLAPTPLGGR